MNSLNAIDTFYLQHPEPIKSCLVALRTIILSEDQNITSVWKYGMPFFCYKQKRFCYLWVHKKYLQPYIGIVEGKYFEMPELISEKRARMKIMLLDPNEDLPIKKIQQIIKQSISLCENRIK